MKQLLFLIAAAITLNACHYKKGSGIIISEKRSTEAFKGIAVSGGFELELRNGPVTDVTVESDDNIIKYIETSVHGDILKISLRNLHNFGDIHLKVYITAPEITSIKASGGAEVISKDLLKNEGSLAFTSSGGGSITAQVDAPEIRAETSSGSTIELSGKTRNYSAKASSGAALNTKELLCESTNITASSGASAHVHASLSLTAKASSGAVITYRGNAALQKTTSSGGSVEKGD